MDYEAPTGDPSFTLGLLPGRLESNGDVPCWWIFTDQDVKKG